MPIANYTTVNKVIKYLQKELQLWPSPNSLVSSHRKVKGILIGAKNTYE